MTATLPPSAAPEHLTRALRAAGVLGSGAVTEVAAISDRTMLVSRILRLGLRYDGPSGDAPTTLILKVPLPAFSRALAQAGRREISFYNELAPLMPPGLVPRSFGGAVDQDAAGWHLLLEDLTDSHQAATLWPLPPSVPQAEAIVRTMARLHAAWWNDRRLGVTVGSFASPEETLRHCELFADHYRRFADALGDLLSPARRATYERFLASTPRLLQRHHSRRDVSIIQGDAHSWNFLVPNDPSHDDVRVFDFDNWRVTVPAQDLAYMIAMHLYPERRGRVERSLLDLYHRTLLAHDVAGYDRAALDDDYRLAVLWQISKPIWQWALQLPPLVWWNNLERIFLAVDDLGCRDWLDS